MYFFYGRNGPKKLFIFYAFDDVISKFNLHLRLLRDDKI